MLGLYGVIQQGVGDSSSQLFDPGGPEWLSAGRPVFFRDSVAGQRGRR
ncbi:hypothetical protein SLNWT_6049 [Streptomyces albus]|uniref:Uncharacterized protein n=1 Tax=Streptomyces albus (strain ATCC 21838 / DSM 41398 / FERM P-419 / JCM 4703 / NBRC 107858) TaxID=1081613 RepID=A0A0B5F4B2_STRA4|nr:hypothetical protein SLNWT_6049 [Streptomyces albus]AOU80728.1 hypothetical protein SLNHY_6037 [Streptomyces albus]